MVDNFGKHKIPFNSQFKQIMKLIRKIVKDQSRVNI